MGRQAIRKVMKITTADAKRRAKAAGCPRYMWDTESALSTLSTLTDLLNAAWAEGMEDAAEIAQACDVSPCPRTVEGNRAGTVKLRTA